MNVKIRFNGDVVKVRYLCGSFAVPSPKSKLWIIGDEFGPTHLITADNVDKAYGKYLDDQIPISEDEATEAFGVDSFLDLTPNELESLELKEGIEYLPKATGTSGIDNVGYYVWIKELLKNTNS
jgi:hypothetical protein